VLTFAGLQREEVRFASGLRQLGVAKGTPVGIYMGMVPELVVAMLACARLGAPFTIVFGGFSAEALGDRLRDMHCRLLITQDEGLLVRDVRVRARGGDATCGRSGKER
jgi:acetyl-CoA synthetase